MNETIRRIFPGIMKWEMVLFVAVIAILPGWSSRDFSMAGRALADPLTQGPSGPIARIDDGECHTPLAGEPFHTVIMRREIDIPRRDRGKQTALVLGGALYWPDQGDMPGSPIFDFYLKRTWERARLRIVASGFVNDLDAARGFGNFEVLGRFENDTIPFKQEGFWHNREVDESSVKRGTLSTLIGGGFRFPVAPYQVDNNLRLQLFGRVGYLYSQPTSRTGPTVKLPPDTLLYGATLRGRYDGFRRNLLELPHTGMAGGFDLDFVHRSHWADFGNPQVTFQKEDTQSYLKLSGYWMGIWSIPGLSEKNRLLTSIHGGMAERKSIDRYNAFRFSSGPFAAATDDLDRLNYPGALFTQALVSRYLLITMEYRRELLFFLYLHLRGTFVWADRATIVGSNQIGFTSANGQDASVGLTSGFLWNSQLYIEYSRDSGFLRDGKPGKGFLLFWSKCF